MRRNYKLSIALSSFAALLGTSLISPVATNAAIPTAKADCSTGRLELTMTPPADHAFWAIRVDDIANPWNPTAMNENDFQYNQYKENTYGRNVARGHQYNWWVHSISKTGVWTDAKGGTVNCPLKYPMYVESSYDHPSLTFTWRPVEGAVKYAVRADDRTVSPDGFFPDNPEADDKAKFVTTNSFSFGIGRDRKVAFWVHAIDKYGVWSDASEWKNVTTK